MTPSATVRLTPDEGGAFGRLGILRLFNALDRGRRGAHGFDQTDAAKRYLVDIEGVLSEYAVARYLGVPFHPSTEGLDTELGDVLPGLQVRSSPRPNASLLLHDKDSDDDIFVLVTGQLGHYTLRGWTRGLYAKRPHFWKELTPGRPCYVVPQPHLLPIDQLVSALGLEKASG